MPCARCRVLGVGCSLEETASLVRSVVITTPDAKLSSGCGNRDGLMGKKEPFCFLLHFTDPSVEKDRLAISETAECSMRRNIFSSLDKSVNSPVKFPMEDLFVDSGLLIWSDSTTTEHDYFQIDQFLYDGDLIETPKMPAQLHVIVSELVETSRSMIFWS